MDRKRDEDRGSVDLLNEVKKLMQQQRLIELRELIEKHHIIDILEIMKNLEENMKINLYEILPIDIQASILEESDDKFFSDIFLKLDEEHKKNILEMVSLGDMADILNELEEDVSRQVIRLFSKEDANELREILIYKEESTGSIMSNKYIQVRKDMTAKQTIEYMRENASDAETIYYIYVIDNENKLVGVLSLRELIVARESTKVEDLMTKNIKFVYDYEDREEAVKIVTKYNLVAIPVVDENKKLKGIITVDDIIDVIEEEKTEDMYKFAGTSEQEWDIARQQNKSDYDQIISSITARIPWLLLMLTVGIIASVVFWELDFIKTIEYSNLIVFIPLIMGMGGNIGTQSSALTVMSLSSKDLKYNNVLREALVGIITGIICSFILGLLIYVFLGDINIVIIVSISLVINMVVGAMIGGFIPLFLKKLNIDPSIISAPLMSSVLDITGLCIYYIVIYIVL